MPLDEQGNGTLSVSLSRYVLNLSAQQYHPTGERIYPPGTLGLGTNAPTLVDALRQAIDECRQRFPPDQGWRDWRVWVFDPELDCAVELDRYHLHRRVQGAST